MKKIWLFVIIILAILWWIWAYWYFCIYNPKTLIEYYPNGQIRYEYHEAYGSLHWPQIDYYKDGQIYRQNYYFHGQQHWQSITFYENGQEADVNYYYYWKQVWDSFSYRPTWEIRYQWRYIDWLPVDWESIVYYEDWSIEWKIRYKSWDILCSSEWYDWSWEKVEETRFRWICVEPDNLIEKNRNTYYELVVYTWIFHNNYVDDNYQYLWDISITWDTHWKLRGYKWDTWYIYNYTFDAWWDINDMFYQTITVTFTSPNSINWESDLMTWYGEWNNVPYFRAPLIKLFAIDRWVQIWDGDTRPSFWIRCFSDPLSDSRFRKWLVPAYSSWITELTTISNKSVEVPFINHDSTVQFTYGFSTPYLWDFMDQCILELSHTQNNDIQLPFKLSWWFWDSASIIWWNNKQSDSYCKRKDIEIEIANWMKCYIESDNDTNVSEVKLWDIRDIQ